MNAAGLLSTPGLPAVLAALPRARLVGGCVRDMLAGRDIADIDIATPDAPESAMAALQKAGLRVIPTGLAHGTITAISEGRPFEITTLRRDDESFGRHARVSWTEDFHEDAARRDFTMNAMSLGQDGTLYDYFGGADDLRAGKVRFVGVAAQRVREDYLRILRFFRFFARFGTAAPDADAVRAIRENLDGMALLSAERVAGEVTRILAAPDPRVAVALMEQLGVLDCIFPDGHDAGALAALVARGAPADPLLRLAALARADADALADRLKLSNAERERLRRMREAAAPDAAMDDRALRRLLADAPADLLLDRAWLAGPVSQALVARLQGMPRPEFPLEGRDALAPGAAPGPHIGAALREVRAAWLASGCVLDRDALVARLADVLQRRG